MSDKTHCNLCDDVIDPTVQRLTLRVGLWTGDEGIDEERGHDYCRECVAGNKFLKALLRECVNRYPESAAAGAAL